jgi:tape measure domain-containing protein
MQIASMFASLGFKVDTSGLDKFKQSLASARHEFTNLNQGVKQSSKHLRSLKSALESVDTALNKVRGAGANNRIIVSYRDMATAVEKVNKHLQNITTHQPNTTKAIGKINSSVHAGVKHWNDYANAVNRARDALRQVRSRIQDIRSNSNISINVRQSGNLNGHGSVTGSPSNATGGMLGGTTIIPLGGRRMLAGLFGGSLQSALLGGGIASVGYGAAQAVKASQEQTRMEMALTMSSKNLDEFNDSLKYVKEEALRLGLTSVDLGKAFAQVNIAAEGLSQDQKKRMFSGVNKYMATVGLDKEAQGGVYRAMYQMFSKGKIQQEEVNQLAERGMSIKVFRDSAMQAYGIKDVNQLLKMQQNGQLTDVGKVWQTYADNLDKMAEANGAADAMRNSSITQINRFKESLKQLSKELMDSGLDQMLGSVFKGLTAITDALIPLAQNLKPVIGGIQALGEVLAPVVDFIKYFISENIILSGVLLLTIGKGAGLARVIERVIFAFRNGARFSGVFAYVMRTVMGNALLRTIGRFGIWGVAIWGVSKALSFVYEQMERKKLGQYTFFDWLMGETRIAALEVKVLGAEIGLMFANLTQAARNLPSLGLKKLSEGIRDSVGLNPQQHQQAVEKNKNRSTSGYGGGVLGLGLQSSNNIPIPSNSNQPVQFTARNVSVYTDSNGRNTIKVDGGQVSLPYIG